MWNLLRILLACMSAGVLLAICLLTPGGAAVGACNGLLVGICVALAEHRARRSENVSAGAAPIRLIGSHAELIA